jgi:hypothetical protein
MKKPAKILMLMTAAAVAGAVGLFWSGDIAPRVGASLTTEAQAIIGMPLTPISYAGVARRSIY